MQKFGSVGVLAALKQIVRQNTTFYQSNFSIDKSIIGWDTASDQTTDKTLLWMSRPFGAYCFRERDVFLKDIRQYNIWKFYGEQTCDKILTYAVELTDMQGGTIWGSLYEPDYLQHSRHIIETAQPVSVNRLFYEHGTRDIPGSQHFDGNPDRVLGNFLYYEAQPRDSAIPQEVLRAEQRNRGRAVSGDFRVHATALYDSRTETEVQRVVGSLKDLFAPNSPNKTYFMVEISSHFAAIASAKGNDRLFVMLPCKSLCFIGMKGRHGAYVVIDRSERRDVSIYRPRPSIRKQLSDSKQAASPRKAAARTEKNELEIREMMHFTVEGENLICMHHNVDRRRTINRLIAVMPVTDGDMRAQAQQTLSKLERTTDADCDGQKFHFTDEQRTTDARRGSHMVACVRCLFFLPIPTRSGPDIVGDRMKYSLAPANMQEKPCSGRFSIP